MSKDKPDRPRSFEVRFTVDEFMGSIFDTLSVLPAKYRHREALTAARAHFDGRNAITPARTSTAATSIEPKQAAPTREQHATRRAEGVARMGQLDQLVAAVSQDLLEGPP